MTSANDRKRAQRERAKAAGLCLACCYRKAKKGRQTCQPCADAAYARVKAHRAR